MKLINKIVLFLIVTFIFLATVYFADNEYAIYKVRERCFNSTNAQELYDFCGSKRKAFSNQERYDLYYNALTKLNKPLAYLKCEKEQNCLGTSQIDLLRKFRIEYDNCEVNNKECNIRDGKNILKENLSVCAMQGNKECINIYISYNVHNIINADITEKVKTLKASKICESKTEAPDSPVNWLKEKNLICSIVLTAKK